MSNLLEYTSWKLSQAKTLLNLTDDEIAKITGSTRPTVSAWKSEPWRMPVGALAKLEDHLTLVASALRITELAGDAKVDDNQNISKET